ncbi:Cerato-platanin [Peziza echinospora]|nr:Cerato-platanin [Peziza echinospora]
MKSFTAALTLLLAPLLAAAQSGSGSASWDDVYGNPTTSTLVLACSDGVNGLYTKGYSTLGAVPGFPYVGAAPTIAGWNSPNCGACFRISWNGSGKTIYITGVDTSRSSGNFVLSQQALNDLTNNQAVALGRVDVVWEQIPSRPGCGIPGK